MKRILKEYFSFTKKERRALLLLLLLLAGFILAPYFYPQKKTVPVVSPALLELVATQNQPARSPLHDPSPGIAATADRPSVPARLFYFDPNTLDEQGWLALGLNSRLVHTLLKYRNKGGRFRKPADIRKIWGMQPAVATKLEPYVRIAAAPRAAIAPVLSAQPLRQTAQVGINTATAADWEALPGIGPVLARRILAFREKLGGFTKIEQVAGTYGLRDSVFQQIRAMLVLDSLHRSPAPRLLQLNRASVYEMVNSLFISLPMAKAIVAYRKTYGNFLSVAGLKQIVVLPDSVYQRILPLLRCD